MDPLVLKKSDRHPPCEGPLLLVIMDGVGEGLANEGNAVHLAYTPVLDRLKERYPWQDLDQGLRYPYLWL